MRLWRWIAAGGLVVGIAALLGGLSVLEGVFMDERRTAYAQINDNRAALELYAREALAARLARQLRQVEPRIMAATEDPLLDATGLLLVRAGTQVLPQLWRARSAPASSAIQLFETLRSDEPIPTPFADGGRHSPSESDHADAGATDAGETPWAQRVRLRNTLLVALQAADRAAIESGVRAVLAHRVRYALPPRQDVPFVLAVIDLLTRYSQPSPILVRGLLRDGIEARDRKLEGLERVILERRSEFSAEELRYIGANIAPVHRYAGLSSDEFLARLSAPSGPHIAVPSSLTASALLLHGGWYAEPRAEGQIVGMQIALSTMVADIHAQMVRRDLIGERDSLQVRLADFEPLELHELSLTIDSRASREAKASADRLFRTKTALVAACGLLVLSLVLMAALTQRRKRKLVALKSRFVAAVSHELRTPLASMRLMAETLQHRLAGDPRAGDYPDRIIRDVEGLSALVENVLSFSRLQKGQIKLRREPIGVNELLQHARTEIESSARPGALKANGDVTMSLQGDRELLGLLFANLARNAVQHNAAERVEVNVTIRTGHHLTILFQDNGVGIPKAMWTRVFHDFERGASVASRGSGLGLALCREIAELHGGRITIEDSSSAGTTFRVELPT